MIFIRKTWYGGGDDCYAGIWTELERWKEDKKCFYTNHVEFGVEVFGWTEEERHYYSNLIKVIEE